MSTPPQDAPDGRPVRDRRRRQRLVPGGQRATDPPLTTRDCADWIGVSTDYILGAIKVGDLRAERFGLPGRRAIYRIHLTDFVVFLRKIRFERLPKHSV